MKTNPVRVKSCSYIQILLLYSFIIFVIMNSRFSVFSNEQRTNAIRRLTALWAFTESGLGGIMHALQIPFTGLVVGGMAVIMICLIAVFSNRSYNQVLKSVMVVLIIKAMASPFTPVTAYVAVSFQALMGFALFSLLRVNYISILLLSILAMLESAMQKLLLLVLFFGESLWKAIDNLIAFAGKQLGFIVSNGSYWIITAYLLIYFVGGLLISWLVFRIIRNFETANPLFVLNKNTGTDSIFVNKQPGKKRPTHKKIWILLFVMLLVSALLFFFASDKKNGVMEVIKTVTWTLSAMLIWFVLLGPLVAKAFQRVLKQKQSRYISEVSDAISFLPVLNKLTNEAWRLSRAYKGLKRWDFFFTGLIYAALTWTEPVNTETKQL